MGTANETLLKQLRITCREIQRRKEFFGFTDVHTQALKSLHSVISDRVQEVVDKFYKHIMPFTEIDRLIGDAETLKKLRNHQRMYILSLFQGEYDDEYVHSRLRIGVVHKRIGVEPKYYVSAVQHLGEILKNMVISFNEDNNKDECFILTSSIDKILLFDLSLIFDTYIHSLMDEVRRSQEELENYTESLEHVINDRTELLKEQARVDGLTGLINQSHFYEELRKELSRGQRRGHTTSLIYCDLDGFKALNDTHGHRTGDEVLKEVASALKESVRRDEPVARYGGDEFCIIIPEGSINDARTLAGRVNEVIKNRLSNYDISCSIGIASSSPSQLLDTAALVKAADKAMYTAKQKTGFSIYTTDDAVEYSPETET